MHGRPGSYNTSIAIQTTTLNNTPTSPLTRPALPVPAAPVGVDAPSNAPLPLACASTSFSDGMAVVSGAPLHVDCAAVGVNCCAYTALSGRTDSADVTGEASRHVRQLAMTFISGCT